MLSLQPGLVCVRHKAVGYEVLHRPELPLQLGLVYVPVQGSRLLCNCLPVLPLQLGLVCVWCGAVGCCGMVCPCCHCSWDWCVCGVGQQAVVDEPPCAAIAAGAGVCACAGQQAVRVDLAMCCHCSQGW